MRLLRQQESTPFLTAEEGRKRRFFQNFPCRLHRLALQFSCLRFWGLVPSLTARKARDKLIFPGQDPHRKSSPKSFSVKAKYRFAAGAGPALRIRLKSVRFGARYFIRRTRKGAKKCAPPAFIPAAAPGSPPAAKGKNPEREGDSPWTSSSFSVSRTR